MTPWTCDWLHRISLFAAGENSRMAGMADSFRGEKARWSSYEWTILTVAVGSFVIVCWLISIWLRRVERVRVVDDPRAMFRTLCKAHNLDRKSKSLLRRLVQEQQLQHPGLLFVEPERFAAERLAGWSPQDASRAARLRERLFQ